MLQSLHRAQTAQRQQTGYGSGRVLIRSHNVQGKMIWVNLENQYKKDETARMTKERFKKFMMHKQIWHSNNRVAKQSSVMGDIR